MIHMQGVGSAKGNGIQCIFGADPLFRAQHNAGSRLPVDRTPCCEQRCHGCNRRIGMDGVGHPFALRCASGIHSVCAVRPHGDRGMLVAPVIDMVGKQIDADTQLGHASELAGICHLAMLQGVPVIRTRIGQLRGFHRIKHQFRCFIAIGVDMKMQTSLVIAKHQFAKRVRVKVPQAVGLAIMVAGPFQTGGKSLNGSIGHHLAKPVMKAVIIVLEGAFRQRNPFVNRLFDGVQRRHQPQGISGRLAGLCIGGKRFLVE